MVTKPSILLTRLAERGNSRLEQVQLTLTADTVNGKVFDASTPLKEIKFNKTQEWDVMDSGIHPLHMHLYHFQIASPEGCGHHEYGEWYNTGELSVALDSDHDLLDLPTVLKLTTLSLSTQSLLTRSVQNSL